MSTSSPPPPLPLHRRISIPLTSNSPAGLIEAHVVDPWEKATKYSLWWTYFALALSALVLIVRLWHFWQDRIRRALYKQEVDRYFEELRALDFDYAQQAIVTGHTANAYLNQQTEQNNHGKNDGARDNGSLHENNGHIGGDLGMAENGTTGITREQTTFQHTEVPQALKFKPTAHLTGVSWINDVIALFRWVFYRPLPDFHWRGYTISFSSMSVFFCVFLAILFVVLIVFLQQPLYWQSIKYGSPPVAIRAGMLAIAITPWMIATSMKANILTLIIGIGPERLNVFHRWLGYITFILSLVHTIPFYVQPVWDDGGMVVFSKLFPGGSSIIYGTGISCLVPLIWLCVASLPFIRRIAYEVFVTLHAPVAAAYVGLLFWHTKNYLASWDYLYTSVVIWAFCYLLRFFNLNWVKPWWQFAFLTGDEAAVTLLPENAVKITIPTRMRWKPGQFVYLRMPGISLFDNHPFTISSMCSGDFPSAYGEDYRDCVIVFKPYGGFTRRVLESAIDKGPFRTYRAFLDGPYGGLRRDLSAFDTVILIAGGSGITALMSQLLNLIKRMRDGKVITRKIVVVWAIKRLEAMDWFREELRICRESAPPESITCKFFVTASKQREQIIPDGNPPMETSVPLTPGLSLPSQPTARALAHQLHDKLDGFVSGIASKRNSTLIMAEAQGDGKREQELRAENEDKITALPPQEFLQGHNSPACTLAQVNSLESWDGDRKYPLDKIKNIDGLREITRQGSFHFPPMQNPNPPHFNHVPPTVRINTNVGLETKESDNLPIRAPELAHLHTTNLPPAPQQRPNSTFGPPAGFEFGFPETPTEFQKSLMRFAFPVPHQIDGGWSVEYGRPDLGFMLKEWATGGPDGRGILGRRTAVFVCGPPEMREGVARTVASLQANIWGDEILEEIFLHTENYAL